VRNLLCVALLSALAACGGSFFRSNAPPPSTYLLSIPPGSPGAAMQADLTILTPRVRTGLDGDRIAALYPDRRLDYFAGARWSGPLDEVVQDLALQAFRTHANFRTVHTDTSAFGAGYWLELDVVDFQAEYPGGGAASESAPPTVHVQLLARVGNAGDRHVIGQYTADSRQPATDNRLSAIVAAYNQAVDAVLSKIVADTVQAVNDNSIRR
jgi:cholesterol transport system auxiliary component